MMLSPVSWRTPPRHYGPWELVASELTEQLVKLGVDVTLFASHGSQTTARLHAIVPPYSEDLSSDRFASTVLHISEVFERADEFDIIHNHFDFVPLTYSRLVGIPLLTTVHGFSSPAIFSVYRKYANLPYVSVSYASRVAGLNYVANVYHGVDTLRYPFSERSSEYLLYLGRIAREKGVDDAIQLAKMVGRPLRIAGIIQDQAYFQSEIEPHLDGREISFLGPVGGCEKLQLLAAAYATVQLSRCEEVLSMSAVESLACGTPVIASRRGGMPEVVDDQCGIVVDSVGQAVESFSRIEQINRHACRRRAEERFGAARMAKEYIEAYRAVVQSPDAQ